MELSCVCLVFFLTIIFGSEKAGNCLEYML